MNTFESNVITASDAEVEQGNILDVLYAHSLLGSSEWIFPAEAQSDLEELYEMGLVYFVSATQPGSFLACLTGLGKNMMAASEERFA